MPFASTAPLNSDLVSLLSSAPPIVVLVVVVFMFLKHMREREASASKRDDQFLDAMRGMLNEVKEMTTRNEQVSREMVQVMGQATEALRRIDQDLHKRNER
jgi:hypothetical protein